MWTRLKAWFVHRQSVASAHRSYNRIRAAYERDRKGRETTDEEASREHFELSMVEDELQQLNSRRLIQQAHRCGIPIPEFSDKKCWEENQFARWVLTIGAMDELRTKIRKEQNERWQFWELRVKVISLLLTGITGAAGALIGLVAILYK